MHPATKVLTLLLAASLATPAFAVWPKGSSLDLPVCTASGSQSSPAMVSDGGAPAGGGSGAIVTWQDNRGATADIYAQHVLASGVADPAWPADGLVLCSAAGNQQTPVIVSDGAGGAIVAWQDLRGGPSGDVYAQHVLGSGAVDPAWPADGRALCTAAGNQLQLAIVSDGAGGAIVTWVDGRSDPTGDIYAQHVLASGAVDPVWPADGRALCTAGGEGQFVPKIASDGAGGAIVTWWDWRDSYGHVYAQRILASGTVDPAWPVNGRAIYVNFLDAQPPVIASDGAGGAIVSWPLNDIYAQHLLASGAVDPAWPAGGRALCTATGTRDGATIVPDGAGGAIVTWQDRRSGTNDDVYAQHVLASGAVDPAWPADGRALCTAAGDQLALTIVADGAGGAMVTWTDQRGGAGRDIYAQHVLASGAVDATWPADGNALSTAANDQIAPTIVLDGGGGVIVAWQDQRSGSDIYAQRVARFGIVGSPEPAIESVLDLANDQGGRVRVRWTASQLDEAPDYSLREYGVWRQVSDGAAQRALAAGARSAAADEAVRVGAVVASPAAAGVTWWECVGVVPGHGDPWYTYVAETLADSGSAGPALTAFRVSAHHVLQAGWWDSPAAQGYSVDNLAPAAPAPFTGQYAGGSTHLHWNPNGEADLAGYRLYRGSSAAFVPDESSLVATLADTGYVDAAGAPYFYKLTAVDTHGNESPVASLLPAGTTDVDDAPAARAFFALAGANPSRGATGLRFGLATAGRASLALYDAGGRRVRTLLGATLEAGEHAASWDGRDEAGRAAPAGLYFAKLEAPGFTRTLRLVRAE